jgi:spore coat polysaccharide biosynthesis predicted glycosyltransferase SpsG
MSDARHVTLDTAGGLRAGVGHLLRSIVLAERLRALKADASLLSTPKAPPSLALHAIRAAGLRAAPQRGSPPRVVVVDRPDTTPERLELLHRRWPTAALVALDYYGPAVDGLALVVNLNEARETRAHSRAPLKARGLRYVILRDSFRVLRRRRRLVRAGIRQILVGFGGTDPNAWSDQAASVMTNCFSDDVSVRLLTGEKQRETKSAPRPGGRSITRHVTVADPAPLMAASDLAIISGGTMLAEAAYLGVPAVVVPRTQAERLFARRFSAAGAARVVEPEDGRLPARALARLVRKLADDKDARRRMQRAGRRLIDGRGVERIARLIMDILENGK